MTTYLAARRVATTQRLEELCTRLAGAEEFVKDQACVYATGSFGRGEASSHSDLDLFIAGRVRSGTRALSRLDEICLKAELIKATRALGIQEFSGDGEYLVHYTVDQLVKTLGRPEDDASNTFTARLLLLLESSPLLGPRVYWEAIDDAIKAYWGDFEDHRADFAPAFFANDILRIWRTFCVNYEARTAREPEEKKAKRKLKNYKLKHSRLLTCYSALAYLLAVFASRQTVTPEDAKRMVGLTPTARLEVLVAEFGVDGDLVEKLITAYERFLTNTDVPEESLIGQFRDSNRSRQYVTEAGEFGDLVAELIVATGKGSKFSRLLLV